MKTKTQKITFTFEAGAFEQLKALSKQLNTSYSGVLVQALALLRLAQGRRVQFKRNDTHHYWETVKYENQPIEPDTAQPKK